jgi:hypothetical protein
MCLWCCSKDLDEQDLFGKIWIQNVGDIDFLSDFCCRKFTKKSKKPGFGRKNQLRTTREHLKAYLSIQAVQKKIGTYAAKQCSHV